MQGTITTAPPMSQTRRPKRSNSQPTKGLAARAVMEKVPTASPTWASFPSRGPTTSRGSTGIRKKNAIATRKVPSTTSAKSRFQVGRGAGVVTGCARRRRSGLHA